MDIYEEMKNEATEIIKWIANSPYNIDFDSVPKAGIDSCPEQVVGNLSLSYVMYKKLLEVASGLNNVEPDHIMVNNDMAFDPTLLGFKKSKQSDDSVDVYKKGKFFLELDKSEDQWLLVSKNKQCFFFENIEIPDHNFGVKLVSQFVEVE